VAKIRRDASDRLALLAGKGDGEMRSSESGREAVQGTIGLKHENKSTERRARRVGRYSGSADTVLDRIARHGLSPCFFCAEFETDDGSPCEDWKKNACVPHRIYTTGK